MRGGERASGACYATGRGNLLGIELGPVHLLLYGAVAPMGCLVPPIPIRSKSVVSSDE